MGQQLTYEIGKLNIGRRVKLMGKDNKQHGMGGHVMEAHPTHAVCRIDNHGQPEKIAWDRVRDWTSMNNKPLVVPVRAVPRTVTIPASPAPAVQTQSWPPPPPVAPADSPFAFYAQLGPSLELAVREVSAAEDMVNEAMEQLQAAQATHSEAVSKVNKLRKQAEDALKAVDLVLAGTSLARA